MQMGKVIGTVVASRKAENLEGIKLLVVNCINEKMEETDEQLVSTDTVSAGVGDVVLVCTTSSARMTKQTRDVCTDNSIIAIIDTVTSYREIVYKKTDFSD